MKRRFPGRSAFALSFVLLWAVLSTPVAAAPACAVPPETFEQEPVLAETRAALAAGKDVTIVTVGGASTAGRAAGGGDAAWPGALSRALRAIYPGARVNVVNLSVARDTAEAMLARITRDVLPMKPQLVIWETGITDSVRGTDLSDFSDTLQKGIDVLRTGGAEVVLMDMQFSRHSEFILDLQRYLEVMHRVAEINDVPQFPRHDLMREWSDQGVFDYRVRGREKRSRLAIDVYDCIGRAVARMIVRGGGAR